MSLPTPLVADSRPPSRTGRRARTGVATPYDFSQPIQLSREHSRVLQLGFDSFTRQATTVFTSVLRSVCSVTLTAIDQRSYAEYIDSLDAMTYLTIFTTEPMPGRGVLNLPLGAVMSCVDHMLGGPGTARQPKRELTEIETGVVVGLVERLLSEMRYSMESIVAVDPQVTGVEYSPQFAQAASASEVMVVIAMELRIDERPFPFTVCLPFAGLHPHLTSAAAPAPVSSRERAQREEAARTMRTTFEDVPVEVSVRFRSSKVDPLLLADLAPGDVLRLGHPAAAPLDLTVEEQALAHVTPGAQGGRLAALIVSTSNRPTASAANRPFAPQENR